MAFNDGQGFVEHQSSRLWSVSKNAQNSRIMHMVHLDQILHNYLFNIVQQQVCKAL